MQGTWISGCASLSGVLRESPRMSTSKARTSDDGVHSMSRQTLNRERTGTDNMIPVLATRYAPLQVFLRQYANQAREFVKSERLVNFQRARLTRYDGGIFSRGKADADCGGGFGIRWVGGGRVFCRSRTRRHPGGQRSTEAGGSARWPGTDSREISARASQPPPRPAPHFFRQPDGGGPPQF